MRIYLGIDNEVVRRMIWDASKSGEIILVNNREEAKLIIVDSLKDLERPIRKDQFRAVITDNFLYRLYLETISPNTKQVNPKHIGVALTIFLKEIRSLPVN